MRLIDADKLREIYSDKMPVILEKYGFRTEMGILLGARYIHKWCFAAR